MSYVAKYGVGPSGAAAAPLVPEASFNLFRVIPTAGANSSPQSQGIGITNVGTLTARTPANTDWLTAQPRLGYVSAAGAGSLVGSRDDTLIHWRGGALSRSGGWRLWMRIGLSVTVADQRLFFGLRGSAAAPTDVEPSSLLNIVGMGADGADTELNVYFNDGAGASTVFPLGPDFPKADGAAYELYSECAPGGADIIVSARRLDTSVLSNFSLQSSNIPGANTFLGRYWYASNNTTASAIEVEYMASTSVIEIPPTTP